MNAPLRTGRILPDLTQNDPHEAALEARARQGKTEPRRLVGIDGDDIGRELARLVVDHWPRFAIRFSNAPVAICSTVSIEHPLQKPADAIVCPQQVGKTASCSTCALCWSTERRIAFLRH